VHPYLRRRNGEEEVTYPHPSLKPVLERTLGVPLFQEQGMQVAIIAAGFMPGEADVLRKAMGHKRSRERMAAICQRMFDGMAANGYSADIAERIFNQINGFADYGFPESHAASFALLVYASAYLKHYYAPEFTAAILNAQPMGFYAPGTLVEDARRHGVEVRPADLTKSKWDATLEHRDDKVGRPERSEGPALGNSNAPAVRLGIRSIRGLGAAAADKLEAALNERPFTSVEDVVQRAGLDRRALRHLAEAGALDAFLPHEADLRKRRAALWAVLEAARGDAGPLAPRQRATIDVAPVPAMTAVELTEADYRMTGISLAGHPMSHVRSVLELNGVRTARDLLQNGRDGETIATAGLVICRQRPGTAKGFVFLTLEDETGLVNVVVTPQRFERQALLISRTPLLLVRGVLQVEQKVVNVRAKQFRALQAAVGAEFAQRHDFH
jgi:error-prone DNA polymerase